MLAFSFFCVFLLSVATEAGAEARAAALFGTDDLKVKLSPRDKESYLLLKELVRCPERNL